jgi:ATP-dependent phosphoenolpyruvate carboxykinase
LHLLSKCCYKDVILTGSLANYNWSGKVFIDLHIAVNFEDINEDIVISKSRWCKKTIGTKNMISNKRMASLYTRCYETSQSK